VLRHCDAGHLEELLQVHAVKRRRSLVLSDGVFPMSGHLAPLAEYLRLLGPCEGSMLLVDDAHALGVLGASGRGSLELAGVSAENINRDPDVACDGPRVFHTATLSKAVGGHGGLIAGSSELLARVRRSSGWFRGAGAPAAPVAAATAKGLQIVATQPELRRRLGENVTALRRGLAELGLEVESSPAPIVAVRLETAERMQRVQQRLASQGILVAYVRDYVGAGPDGLLRIAVFATHTSEMIDRLLRSLGQVLSEERTP
jgi:7-keto-8-aminopelargonate synthetase-like enzyme